MPLNIYRAARLGALAAAVVALPRAAQAQGCPSSSTRASAEGWIEYRAGRLDSALVHFVRAGRACAANLDAANGQGYVALRRGETSRADSLFALVIGRDSLNVDAWTGIALSARRVGNRRRALDAALRAVRADSANATAREILASIDPDWNRPSIDRPRSPMLELHARVTSERFEVRAPGRDAWQPLWVKGVNLGAALPGRFPAEFPEDSALYGRWIGEIAGMNANAVRVYTILPPAFYRALAAWNAAQPDRALWLVQGVWAELPPDHDFRNAAWLSEVRDELRRAVDVVHGGTSMPPRPGHAAGRYDSDVSRWTLAFIVGREWEPFAVKAFDQRHPGRAAYRGRMLEGDSLTATERWVAEACDSLLAYELDRYNALRPVAFTNWPTLDPLHHPTESSLAEEAEWRRRTGRRAAATALEYENDVVALDASRIRATPLNPGGWFAAYHAYPYYPDFMNLDPEYRRGASSYVAYLRALRAHHAGLALLVAEYGVPSSRGNAHAQPDGRSHGGHDEVAMAKIDAALTREIREAGAAGGIVFAWIDEWFKRNWMVMDFEIPAEHTRRWHNAMDAEQHYGMLAMVAGDSGAAPVLGGDAARWIAPGDELTLGSDESYIYLALRTGAAFTWATHGIEIGIDTWQRARGQHRLPRSGVRSEIGFEFVLDLPGRDSGALRVLPEYNRHAPPEGNDDQGRFLRRPITVADRDDGRFDALLVTTNRARFARDGTFHPAIALDRGALRFGHEAETTLADWYHDGSAGVLEVRIPWDLLNVSDPSTRTIVLDSATGGPIGTARADAFHFEAVVYHRVDGTHRVIRSEPWRWNGWSTPRWHSRRKPVYDAMREAWGAIP